MKPSGLSILFVLIQFLCLAAIGLTGPVLATPLILLLIEGLGLFLGKQIGVFATCWLAIKLGFAKLPNGASWGSLYGVSILCGVGFTMSMFIGSLAFESQGTDTHQLFDDRVGTIIGSMLSAGLAYLVLHLTLPKSGKKKGQVSK